MVPPKFELTQLANAGGCLGGVATDANHNVYVCNATKNCIQRVDQKGGVTVYCDTAPDGPLLVPNYGSFDTCQEITTSRTRVSTGNRLVD